MNSDNGGRAVHGANGAPGLRERKKLATRQALSAAAIRLAVEQGFDNLRVEDIAEAAGVSPRTFNNYFSSKEEAIVSARVTQMERIAQELLARPAEESLLDAIGNAMTAVQDQPRGPTRDVIRLFVCTPSLHAEFLRTAGQTSSPMIDAIAQRTGTDPDDMLPQVATSAAFGALRAAMHQWLNDEESPPYGDLVHDALNQLRVLADYPEASAPERASQGRFVTSRAAPSHAADLAGNPASEGVTGDCVVEPATDAAADLTADVTAGVAADAGVGVDATAEVAVGDPRATRRRLAASALSARRQRGGSSSPRTSAADEIPAE